MSHAAEHAFIRLSRLSKSFGEKKVITDLSLEIKKGEIFGLVGKSGCGKSTLMKILLGIYPPDSGDIVLDGESLAGKMQRIRKVVGYTTQENSFYEKLTVFENMLYYANLYGLSDRTAGKPVAAHLSDILSSVNLLEGRNTIAGRISGGMKRRLDFAISLIHDPSLLILDEPTTGLDPILVSQFWEVVKKNKTKDRTVIVSSHIFSEIEENCDRIGIMHKGAIKKIIDVKQEQAPFRLYPVFRKEVMDESI